jgi:hypothetical protein
MHTKRFNLEDIKRIPVTLSEQAKAIIDASHAQGRLLPLSLSEHFGILGYVESVGIDAIAKSEVHPHAENPDDTLLSINVKYTDDREHQFLIHVDDIQELHGITRIPTVQARHIAEELVRLCKSR